MLLNWFIASTVDEVGISWFDFYSIGHICMGIGIFLFFSLFYTIPYSKSNESQVLLPLWVVWIITILLAIGWEWLENVVFVDLGIKFEGRIDSIENMLTDIILVAIGGLGSWAVCHLVFKKEKNAWDYYVFGIIGFSIWILIFLILRFLTFHNSPIIPS